MSTQDISSFLADIQKLKQQADAQSAENPRFAVASTKLDELLRATQALDEPSIVGSNTAETETKAAPDAEGTKVTPLVAVADTQAEAAQTPETATAELSTTEALEVKTPSNDENLEKPASLTKWWGDKESNANADSPQEQETPAASKEKTGFFTKLVNKKKLAKEPATLRTDRKVADTKAPLISIKTPQKSILTAPVDTIKVADGQESANSEDNSASLAGLAAAGIAGAATLAAVTSSTDATAKTLPATDAPTTETAADVDVKSITDTQTESTTATLENTEILETALPESTPDIGQEAALYAKASAGQFEDRTYEADHVKAAVSAEDMPAGKELLTSISQSENNESAAITATAAATLVSGQASEASKTTIVEESRLVVDGEEAQEDVVKTAPIPSAEAPSAELQSEALDVENITPVASDQDIVENVTIPEVEPVVETPALESLSKAVTADPVSEQPSLELENSIAIENDPISAAPLAAAGAIAAAGIASVALSDTDVTETPVAETPVVDQHLTGVIEISDPQPGEAATIVSAPIEVAETAVQETTPQTEPQLEFAQELPENGLASSSAVSIPIDEATTALENPSVQDILTQTSPVAASLETQTEHEIDISHITGDQSTIAAVPEAAPTVEVPTLDSAPEIPLVAEIPALDNAPALPEITPVAEIPTLDSVTPALPDAAPAAEIPTLESVPEIPSIPLVAEIPALDSAPALPEITPVAEIPTLDSITPALPDAAPAVDVPTLESAPEIPSIPLVAEIPALDSAPVLPEIAPVAEIPTLDSVPPALPDAAPAVEIPTLESAPEIPSIPLVAEIPALDSAPALPEITPVAETPTLDSITPAAIPVAAKADGLSPLANIPLASPAVGETVLVSQPTGQPVSAEAAAMPSHTIPAAQQDGVKTSDLAINSDKVILSGDDIKFHPEYGSKKKGFFSRLFGKKK